MLAFLLAFCPQAWAQEVTGLLKVSSNVKGATILMDGEQLGVTPYTGYVAVGNHRLRVVADDYDPFVRRVDVAEAFTTAVEARLAPGKGTIEFSVKPGGALLAIDGKLIGPTPIRLGEMKPGDHLWRVSSDGYEAQEGEFHFQRGKNLHFELVLRSTEGLFVVDTAPAGATVFLDGLEKGLSPIELTDIPRGEHDVRVHLPGYTDLFRKIDTSDGSKGEVIANLSSKGARLRVKTRQDQAAVSVNGNPIGSGAKIELDGIERGSFTMVVDCPGHKSAQRSFKVPSRGRVTLRADLVPESDSGSSELKQLPPLYKRWTFWTATGGAAVGVTVGAILLGRALAPEPPPDGDIVVVLP